MPQNTFIQIAIGVIPVMLCFTLMAVLSKKHRIRNIVVSACIAVIAISCAANGLAGPADNVRAELKADELRFAYTLVDEGAAELASDVIKTSRSGSVYSADKTLALARIALLEGRIQAAKALYRKLPSSDEQSAVLAVDNTYLASSEALEHAREIARDTISKYLKGFESDNYDAAARAAAIAQTQYADYLAGNVSDDSETSKQLKRISTICEETPELLTITPLRVARLKLQLLQEDFKGIAESVDEYADYNELLIVSELYMNGYVKPSYFSDEYRGADIGDYDAVVSALEDIYNNGYADKSREERNAAKAQIKSLKAFLRNPSLIKVQNALADYAQSEFAYDKSKVYLQLAKTENYMGNPQKSIEYLDKSLNTVGDCDDAEYTTPMYEIIGIIADKDDPERLKDVAVYTEKILSNTMTVQMADTLLEPTVAESEGGDSEDTVTDFETQLNTYVSQKRMAINIVGVDISAFDTVKANINISGDLTYSVDELKALLKVSDCEIDIDSFELEKITYSGANILICADVSGSMAGYPIEDLKSAVQMFVESSDTIESVALVTFNGDISGVWNFGTPDSELIAATQSLYADGSTNMYGAVQEALGYFSPNLDEVNCVILISDGEDNSPAYYQEILDNVGGPYKAKGVTLYSLGLGNGAAGDYLNALAGSTGGKYVYASDSIQIKNFFDGIRAQILNSYRLTFKAEDTFQNSRNLRVALSGESYTYDEFWYTLDGSEAGEQNNAMSVVYLEGKAVYGFEEKLIFKGERSRKLNFKGEGFERDDKISLALEGHIDYDGLAYEFIDASTLLVTIPAGIACDTYNVRVSINGKKTVLMSGLTVAVQGSEKRVEFGDYVFTSYFRLTEGNETRLSQYVQMNGWLNFKGDVLLTGDLGGQSIVLTSAKQEYVHFYPGTAEGLAKLFANRDVPVPAVSGVTLYNQYLFNSGDPDSPNGELRVQPVPVSTLVIPGFLSISSPGLSLYPDRVEINSDGFSTELPFQKQILNGLGLFTFEVNIGGAIGAKSIDLIAEIGGESGESKGGLAKKPINLGNIPMLVSTDEFELRLNTYKNEFYIKYIAELPYFKTDTSFGASLRWDWSDKTGLFESFDEFILYLDRDATVPGSPIKLTFSDFKVGIKDMTSDNPKFTGGFDLSAYKLSSLLPGIGRHLGELGDVSVIAADDVEFNCGLKDFYFQLKTTVKMLKYLELAGIDMQMGKFPYENVLLGMSATDVEGFSGSISLGPAIHVKNCDLALQGELEATFTDQFDGLGVQGNFDVEVRWWVFEKSIHKQGKAMIGVVKSHDGDKLFTIRAKSDGTNKMTTIQWSERKGAYYGTKTV